MNLKNCIKIVRNKNAILSINFNLYNKSENKNIIFLEKRENVKQYKLVLTINSAVFIKVTKETNFFELNFTNISDPSSYDCLQNLCSGLRQWKSPAHPRLSSQYWNTVKNTKPHTDWHQITRIFYFFGIALDWISDLYTDCL